LHEEFLLEARGLPGADAYVSFTGYQLSVEVSDLFRESVDTLFICFGLLP
jgi:hypothetical protein